MAREAVAVQSASRAGLAANYTAAVADGHMFANDGRRTFLHVKNTDASSRVLTFQIPRKIDNQSVANSGRQVTINATSELFLGPFPAHDYNQPSDGRVWLDYSATPGVSIAVVQLPEV